MARVLYRLSYPVLTRFLASRRISEADQRLCIHRKPILPRNQRSPTARSQRLRDTDPAPAVRPHPAIVWHGADVRSGAGRWPGRLRIADRPRNCGPESCRRKRLKPLVPVRGLEPPLCHHKRILSPVRSAMRISRLGCNPVRKPCRFDASQPLCCLQASRIADQNQRVGVTLSGARELAEMSLGCQAIRRMSIFRRVVQPKAYLLAVDHDPRPPPSARVSGNPLEADSPFCAHVRRVPLAIGDAKIRFPVVQRVSVCVVNDAVRISHDPSMHVFDASRGS